MEYNTKLEVKAAVSILKLLWQLLLGNFKLYTLPGWSGVTCYKIWKITFQIKVYLRRGSELFSSP